jgi:hypothetical protein
VVRTIRLHSFVPDEIVEGWRGKLIDERHFDPALLIAEDADVYRPDGTPLLVFRRGVLPFLICQRAYGPLIEAAVPSYNRGDAAGGRYHRTKKDGTLSNTLGSDPVLSGIIGHYDEPRCRVTEYTASQVREWHSILPFIRAVNDVFERELPDRYNAQMRAVRKTHPRYIIPGTAFTTVTVNRNWRTHVHKDKGDLAAGFGVMSVIEAGDYEGGLLVFPKWRVAVDMRTQDALLADVHEYHANTPIVGVEGGYERISTVMYYRTGMLRCGPTE